MPAARCTLDVPPGLGNGSLTAGGEAFERGSVEHVELHASLAREAHRECLQQFCLRA